MVLYFDTETTGLTPGRIIQLSYILESEDKTVGKNFYFNVDFIPEDSIKIHGITLEKLSVLSKGKTFLDYVNEIEKDFSSAEKIVAHNLSFDVNFLNSEFERLDKKFTYKNGLDSMRYFTPILKLMRKSGGYKFPKLVEVADYYDVKKEEVLSVCNRLFKSDGNDFHDARFDAVTLYLSMK